MKKKEFDIAVLGGDRRQICMAEELSRQGYQVCVYFPLDLHPQKDAAYIYMDSAKECMEKAPVLAAGIPLIKAGGKVNGTEEKAEELLCFLEKGQHFFAGCIPLEIKKKIEQQGAVTHDLMEKKSVAVFNSIATAEGILAEAITRSDVNLNKSKCLVLGYGICGKTLVSYLSRLFCQVTVFARREKQRAEAAVLADRVLCYGELSKHMGEFDFIFNTVPALILGEEELKKVSDQTHIFDLATYPGGIDWKAAKELGIQADSYPGLPGKYAPRSCGKELVRQMIQELKEFQ